MSKNRDKRYIILNSFVDALTMEETIDEIEKIIEKKVPTQHVVINASKIVQMEKNFKLKSIVNKCPIINADGASILLASRIMGIPLPERVTGIDLFYELLKLSNKKKYKIFLFGATENVVLKVKNIIKKEYPYLEIVGYRNGYFSDDDEQKIVEQIKKSNPDMVFVAFSSPKKEYWINKYLDQMNVSFVMGVGGSFDVIAGTTRRAPLWMQNHGLEWFFRFIQEPRRMWKRYIIGNLTFVSLIFKYKSKSLINTGRKF